MNTFVASVAGCIVALAIWKETKQNWILSCLGVFLVAIAFRHGDDPFPFNILIAIACFVVWSVVKYFVIDRKSIPQSQKQDAVSS